MRKAIDSLKVYNQLPEDVAAVYTGVTLTSDEAFDSLIVLQNNYLQRVLASRVSEEDFDLLLEKVSLIYSSLSFGSEVPLEKINEAKRLNDTFIYLYRNYLKLERQKQGSFRLQKTLCQFLNYSFQNCVSKFDKEDSELNGISCLGDFNLEGMDKPWDAVFYGAYLYVIDSCGKNNLKIYDNELKLVIAFHISKPTSIAIVNNTVVVTSTYSPEVVFLRDNEIIQRINLLEPIEVVFGNESEFFFITREKKILTINLDGLNSLNSIVSFYIDFPKDYYIDSYCAYGKVLYFASHTDSRVIEFDKTNYSYRYLFAEGLYMPNSIDIKEDLIYMSDKETGKISIYSYPSFSLKYKFGHFSKVNHGNADTTKILPFLEAENECFFAFSWLKNCITKYKINRY